MSTNLSTSDKFTGDLYPSDVKISLSLCRAQERKEIDDYGENDEYKNRKKHIYKEDWADSIYCPLSFQRRGKGNHAGKD